MYSGGREAINRGTAIVRGNMVNKLAPSKGWGPKGGVGHGAGNIAALLVVGGGGRGGVTRTFLICISKPILLHIE